MYLDFYIKQDLRAVEINITRKPNAALVVSFVTGWWRPEREWMSASGGVLAKLVLPIVRFLE